MFLTDLADKLRAYRARDGSGLTVVEVPGWQTRTYSASGMAGNVGVMHHHTATAESAFARSDCPTLSLLTHGRSDLPGPLCNLAFGRSGTVYVVAAGQANHAGRGSIGGAYENLGNFYTIGIEAESSGVRNDWTEAQRRVWPHLAAALDLAYSGGGTYYQVGHKEYSYDGKIDPAFIEMDDLRNDVNDILAGNGGNLQEDDLSGYGKEILDAVKSIKARVDILWGGMFTEFSYSGKPGTSEPGLIPLVKHIRKQVDILWGAIFTQYSMTGKKEDLRPGIMTRLDTIEAKLNKLEEKEGASRD